MMIVNPFSNPQHPLPFWRAVLQKNFTQWNKLLAFLQLDEKSCPEIVSSFRLNLPLRLAEKIAKNTLDDPILKQFLPSPEETMAQRDFQPDPLQEKTVKKTTKLLQKYEGRVLLVCAKTCAMHCRFCFRQNFDYNTLDKSFEPELRLIEEDPSLKEVILSGGDPLSLSDHQLGQLLNSLSSIPHIRRIRFHSRFPIGIPERIDESFLNLLKDIPQQIWFAIHVNHPRELDDDILAALKKLQRLGVVILSQSVLLKGVNDDADTLVALSERLVDNGIFPYYLHQLDRVAGASRFEVSEAEGLNLLKQMNRRLSGYAVPKYVRETAGEASKCGITSA